MILFKQSPFKTLQGRMLFFLLLPVFLIIFIGGMLSFLYTRDIILNQWNESAVLKLQRAAHYIEMRLVKPIEMIETLIKYSEKKNMMLSPGSIIEHITALEGVVEVQYESPFGKKNHMTSDRRMMGPRTNMMSLRNSYISKISKPEFDSDIGQEIVEVVVSMVNPQKQLYGEFKIKLSFEYLLKDIIKLGWWQSDMACIVDQKGNYMAHTNMNMRGRHTLGGMEDPLEKAILDMMDETSYGTVQSEGTPPEMVAGYYRLEHIPWTIILFAKGNAILKPILRYRNAFSVGGTVLIFIILFLIRQHVGKIVKQITALSLNSKNVAAGNYETPILPESKDEIGQLVLNYNEMVNGLQERDFIRDSFGRYVDPEFARSLIKHPEAGKLGGERREVVLMMSDIRGFTPLSESLSPEKIIRVLNHYFSHMIKIIQEHNGIIVDFFGDAILIFFQPLSGSVDDMALCSIQCASRMQSEMTTFNQKMEREGLPSLSMGIGINSGQVVVGNIGSEARAKYGVVGSAVNVTSRIQATAKAKQVVISESIYNYSKDQIQIKKEFTEKLKGVDEPVRLRVIEELL